jgi:serine protein kinase
MEVFDIFSDLYKRGSQDELSLQDFLLGCREDPMMHATAAERMIAAVGEPEVIDTSADQRLGRIFHNRTIRRYPAFKDLYGMEETIERIVGFFRHAAQGLEERKQILYLLGPVGGGNGNAMPMRNVSSTIFGEPYRSPIKAQKTTPKLTHWSARRNCGYLKKTSCIS